MKHVLSSCKYLVSLAFLVVALGCATPLDEKENLALAAGFKIITPRTSEQLAALPRLPANKVTRVNYRGRTYYVLPDFENNQAFVGGPRQYAAYQQLRLSRELSNENLLASEVDDGKSWDWTAWGGWASSWDRDWF